MELTLTLDQILEWIGVGALEGTPDAVIKGISSLESAKPGDLAFLANRKYQKAVSSSKASVIILPENFEGVPRKGQAYLRVTHPSLALAQVCERIAKELWPKPLPGIHPTAVVATSARISDTAFIGPLCVIEDAAEIGDGSILEAQVFVGKHALVGKNVWVMPQCCIASYCEVGKRVRLQSGCVIGSDGYGYSTVGGKHQKEPQVGIVEIQDDVEIGANTTIDRARFGKTVIGRGTKIDNLVQVGHNVAIGQHCLIVSQAGISGSTKLEDAVVMGGKAGVVGHITIGKGSIITAHAGVYKDLPSGSFVRGSPASDFYQESRIIVLRKRLPELFKRVAKLEEMLEES